MGKSTISMAISNSYVSLPEGTSILGSLHLITQMEKKKDNFYNILLVSEIFGFENVSDLGLRMVQGLPV